MAARSTYPTVGALFAERARRMPDRPFLRVPGDEPFTYGETWQRACAVAEVLRGLGAGLGTPIVIMLPNGPEAVFAWLGANLIGAIDVTINTGYVGATFDHALDQVAARHLIIAADLLPVLRPESAAVARLEAVLVAGDMDAHGAGLPLHDFGREVAVACATLAHAPAALPTVSERDISSIIYTSGSTGPAKGVLMPHAQVMLIAAQTVTHMGLGPDDVFYSFHPLCHMAGKFMLLLACAEAGAQLVLDRDFAPGQWLERIRACGATFTGAHGPMLEMIAARPPSPLDRDHALRTICAAPFPRHLAAEFEARFGVRGIEVWGMTEVGIPIWSTLDEPLRPGCCGRVDRAHFDFAIVDPETDAPVPIGDPGEFVVRPRRPWTIMQGYAGMAEATVEAWRNLWFHTGDIGHMDEDGYVYFLDRAGDRIRRRAENIASCDVEAAALSHMSVREAVAIGIASEYAGDDDIRLLVVVEPGQAFAPEALLRHMAMRLPHFMVPRYLEPIETLPRSVTQKVQRRALRAMPLGPATWDRKRHGVRLKQLKETA